MKKLLLLSALLVFACSSDEGNDDYDNSSNQTFLERYDGVVWQNDLFDPSDPENPQADPVYYIFYNVPQDVFFNAGWYDPELECTNMDMSWSNYFLTISIEENNENSLVLQDDFTGFFANYNVSENGQKLTVSIDGEVSQTFTRTTLTDPCE
ncbi:MAG: hypothetical protein ACPG6A_04735 [Flavobacteriaceae bacterium]